MSVSRQKFLGLVGGGVVLAAGISTAAFLTTRTPFKALAPWQNAGDYDDPRLQSMSFALLTPNPHNRQPWLAELLGLFTREAASDVNSPGSRDAIESTANAILSAPAYTLNITPGNTRKGQLEAGRQWMQFNLKTTSLGMALRPVSQALQEYQEVKPYLDCVHDLFASDGGTVQMLGLLGYGALPARTPRWPIESRLMNA